MTKDELSILIGAPVYLAEEEIDKLIEYARSTRGVIVDIGAGFGASAVLFLNNSVARVCSIDPFTSEPGAFSPTCGTRTAEACIQSVYRGAGTNLKGRWVLLEMPSHEAYWKLMQQWPWGEVITLLFIDGDHRYESVKLDYDAWTTLVKRGGIIILHDSRKIPGTPDNVYSRGHVGPTRLADELRSSTEVTLVEECGSMTIWRKN
jgi:predicted O-methyltransferase YrrM